MIEPSQGGRWAVRGLVVLGSGQTEPGRPLGLSIGWRCHVDIEERDKSAHEEPWSFGCPVRQGRVRAQSERLGFRVERGPGVVGSTCVQAGQ
jgi:hypothetical protein